MKISRAHSIHLFACIFLLSLTGCSSLSNSRDPLEPYNRKMYAFNDTADRWVMKPVAQGYRDYTPEIVRQGVDNFFDNLGDANSSLNFALQGEPKPSLYNLSRFLVNSTIGLLGIIDVVPSENRSYNQTGFGDTLATWGWKDSAYFVMPLSGPSTLRDGAGALVNITFRENTLYNNPHDDAKLLSNVVEGINTRENLLGLEDTLEGAALDPYAYLRDAWLQMRAKKLGTEVQQETEEEFNIDDLVE